MVTIRAREYIGIQTIRVQSSPEWGLGLGTSLVVAFEYQH
jgi:hypothetical protein